jgi:hypothetical protein
MVVQTVKKSMTIKTRRFLTIQNSPRLDLILGQMNLTFIHTPNFFKNGFQVLTAASMKGLVAPGSAVEVYQSFIALMMEASTSETSAKSTRLHGATTQKTAIFFKIHFMWSFHLRLRLLCGLFPSRYSD